MTLGVILVIIVVLAAVLLMFPKIIVLPSPSNQLMLGVQIAAPAKALYGDQVDVKVSITYEGVNPVLNPQLTLVATLGGQTIYQDSGTIDLATEPSRSYKIILANPSSVVQTFGNSATIQATVSAGNANASNSTSIQIWEPSVTFSVHLPNDNWNPFGPQTLKSGTYLFKDASAQYTGSDPGTFQVAVGVILDSQYDQFFSMNSKLTQNYNDSGKTVWVIASNTVDSVHPVWNVPTGSSEFTVSTGGADSVTINFEVTLLLVIANGHFLPLATTSEILVINRG